MMVVSSLTVKEGGVFPKGKSTLLEPNSNHVPREGGRFRALRLSHNVVQVTVVNTLFPAMRLNDVLNHWPNYERKARLYHRVTCKVYAH